MYKNLSTHGCLYHNYQYNSQQFSQLCMTTINVTFVTFLITLVSSLIVANNYRYAPLLSNWSHRELQISVKTTSTQANFKFELACARQSHRRSLVPVKTNFRSTYSIASYIILINMVIRSLKTIMHYKTTYLQNPCRMASYS